MVFLKVAINNSSVTDCSINSSLHCTAQNYCKANLWIHDQAHINTYMRQFKQDSLSQSPDTYSKRGICHQLNSSVIYFVQDTKALALPIYGVMIQQENPRRKNLTHSYNRCFPYAQLSLSKSCVDPVLLSLPDSILFLLLVVGTAINDNYQILIIILHQL